MGPPCWTAESLQKPTLDETKCWLQRVFSSHRRRGWDMWCSVRSVTSMLDATKSYTVDLFKAASLQVVTTYIHWTLWKDLKLNYPSKCSYLAWRGSTSKCLLDPMKKKILFFVFSFKYCWLRLCLFGLVCWIYEFIELNLSLYRY